MQSPHSNLLRCTCRYRAKLNGFPLAIVEWVASSTPYLTAILFTCCLPNCQSYKWLFIKLHLLLLLYQNNLYRFTSNPNGRWIALFGFVAPLIGVISVYSRRDPLPRSRFAYSGTCKPITLTYTHKLLSALILCGFGSLLYRADIVCHPARYYFLRKRGLMVADVGIEPTLFSL